MKKELELNDWHLMVLHYLGLDHIGHVEGSHSSKIFQKLLEMDEAIKYIVNNDNFGKSLLLVTGDHGMRNGGSHGGSDKEELYVPLIDFQQKCFNEKRLVYFIFYLLMKCQHHENIILVLFLSIIKSIWRLRCQCF